MKRKMLLLFHSKDGTKTARELERYHSQYAAGDVYAACHVYFEVVREDTFIAHTESGDRIVKWPREKDELLDPYDPEFRHIIDMLRCLKQ